MNTLKSYKQNGYNYKYIVITNGHSVNPEYKLYYTKKQAEKRQ